MPYDLEFEKPLAELEKKIIALRRKEEHLKPTEREQLQKAEQDLVTLTKDIYAHLTDWQTVLVSRHKNRPHTVDYLRLLFIAVVIGEGGSGGALGIALADRVLALEHTYYAVASPESAATIVWRDEKLAPQMANGQRICAKHLKEQGLIDEIIPEPLGGAHRDYEGTPRILKAALQRHLAELQQTPLNELLEKRYQKFRNMGAFGLLAQEVETHEA